jgi:predicted DNA-binding transcriptional regulator YafY
VTKRERMSRGDQVTRIYKIISILEGNSHGLTVKEIHERVKDQFDATERTVRRDLQAIESFSFPLEVIEPDADSDRDAKGTLYKMNRSMKVAKHLTLTPGELFGLYLMRGMLKPLQDTIFYHDLNTFFVKVDSLIPEKDRTYLGEISQELHFEPAPRWGLGIDPDSLETVRAACTNAQVLEFEYESANSQTRKKRRVGPHFLYFAKGSLYLMGEDLGDQTLKVFSIPRMNSVAMSPTPYDTKKVDPEQYFSGSFGVFRNEEVQKVTLRFDSTVTPYVRERRWHASQQVVKLADGGLEMILQVGITPDFIQWVIGFHKHVLVVHPVALENELVKAATELLGLYQNSNRLKKAS